VLGYFTLFGLCLLLFSLCFCFAVREWLRPIDDAPLPVDIEYVRRENYFGESFRAKMKDWMWESMETGQPLANPEAGNPPVRARIEKPDGERIQLFAGGCWNRPGVTEDLIYSEGDLSLPQDAVFRSEIYSLGNVQIGERAELRCVAADGNIVLGADTKVSRWVDSRRSVVLRKGAVVGSRVSSAESITLEPGVSAESLYAPRIFTIGFGKWHEPWPDSRIRSLSVAGRKNPPDMPPAVPGTEFEAGFNGNHCSRLGPETRLVQGDLELGADTSVEDNLVVQGTLRSGLRCSFHGSVKARRVALGPRNTIDGNLISTSALEIGASTHVGGSVIAEEDIMLRTGVRVGGEYRLAVVSAGKTVTMEANVAVSGKIAAGRAVVTV
jgi:predicted acyltransferase (DUF342 family)